MELIFRQSTVSTFNEHSHDVFHNEHHLSRLRRRPLHLLPPIPQPDSLLSANHHILAPDLPGFGFTTVPPSRAYTYTFASFTRTILAFLDALAIHKFAVYIFDYGAPVALRLALQRPAAIAAIVSQNGNAYDAGLGARSWAPVRQYWASGSASDRAALRAGFMTFAATKWQYEFGSPAPERIAPEAYHLDWALLERPGVIDLQLDVLRDYDSNVALYPEFHEYFRKSQVPLLAVWGKNDAIFVPEGAEAFKENLPQAEVHLLDAGHFAVETHTVEIAELMLEFLGKIGF
ncbi:hypothetical protein MMC13_007633 [Lambiella insularis]|nr:hypothetical protein [Lambiella insularis]